MERRTAAATEVREAPEGGWAKLNSAVAGKRSTGFGAAYGNRKIAVGTAWLDDGKTSAIRPGDAVAVRGRIDTDSYETRPIEAGSVHPKANDERLYARLTGEEEGFHSELERYAAEDDRVSVTGTVPRVEDPGAQQLDTSGTAIQVDVSGLTDDPRIAQGDRIAARGERDDADLLESRQIRAYGIRLPSRD